MVCCSSLVSHTGFSSILLGVKLSWLSEQEQRAFACKYLEPKTEWSRSRDAPRWPDKNVTWPQYICYAHFSVCFISVFFSYMPNCCETAFTTVCVEICHNTHCVIIYRRSYTTPATVCLFSYMMALIFLTFLAKKNTSKAVFSAGNGFRHVVISYFEEDEHVFAKKLCSLKMARWFKAETD